MKQLKIILLGLLAIPLIYVIGFAAYYLPSTRKVQITSTEIKRMDVEPEEEGGPTSRDVSFLDTRDPTSGEIHVYRNEDTRWGWPPYFKFDSGDLRAKANDIKEKNPNATVLVTYYGWRIPMLDLFPNAVDLEIVDPRYTHIPWFNIFFLGFVLGGSGFGVLWFRRRVRRWKEDRGGKIFARKKKAALDDAGPAAGAPEADADADAAAEAVLSDPDPEPAEKKDAGEPPAES